MQPSFVSLHLFVVLHLRIERMDNSPGVIEHLYIYFFYGYGKHIVFRPGKLAPEQLFVEQGE